MEVTSFNLNRLLTIGLGQQKHAGYRFVFFFLTDTHEAQIYQAVKYIEFTGL